MKTPSDIVKESEDELNWQLDNCDRFTDTNEVVRSDRERVHDFFRSTSLSLLQSVGEWARIPKKFPERESDEYDAGYKRALDDLSAFISEEIKKLK